MPSAENTDDGADCSSDELRHRAETLFRQGRADDARSLLYQALAARKGSDGTSRALLLEHLGRYLDAGSSSWQHSCFEESLTDLGLHEPLEGRVRVLCSAGLTLVRQGRTDEGTDLLDEAILLTKESGDRGLEAQVRTFAAEASLALGLLDGSLEHTRRTRSLAIEARRHHLVIRSYFNEARATYLKTGNVCDALRVRKAGLRYAIDVGQRDTEEGNTVRLALVEDMVEAGQWPEALELLGPEAVEETEHGSLNAVEETLVRCWLGTWRGERPTAVPPLPHLVESSSPLHQAYLLSLALATASRLADYATVEELTGRALLLADGHLAPPSSGLYVVDALASAIEAQSGRRHTLLHPGSTPDQLLAVIERVHPQARRRLSAPQELTDGIVHQARALVAAPQNAADHWDRAIAVFRRCHARARLVPALLGRAALADPGDPRTALLLDEAEQIATPMRAAPYLERIAELRSVGPGATKEPPMNLTGRQLEVVSLLADGHTDREIAEALRLSVRTVNAHVVQILTRLDVRNRAEAAAWYYRQGPGRGH